MLNHGKSGPRAVQRSLSYAGRPGQALVELAVVAGFLLLLILALFEFGRAFTAWVQLGNMARAGAQYGSMGAFLSPNDDVDAIKQKMIDAAIWFRESIRTLSR